MSNTEEHNLSEANRQAGKHQVDEQRQHILDTAEALFLEKGIANTSMVELARAVGITKVTLYRYFANKDEIAIQIQIRMLKKVRAVVKPTVEEYTREEMKQTVRAHLENYNQLQDAYRFMGMFDQIYLDNPADKELVAWTKEQLESSDWRDAEHKKGRERYPNPSERSVISSALIWFLEKMALRGELTWADSSIPVQEHLKIYEEMVITYLEKMESEQE